MTSHSGAPHPSLCGVDKPPSTSRDGPATHRPDRAVHVTQGVPHAGFPRWDGPDSKATPVCLEGTLGGRHSVSRTFGVADPTRERSLRGWGPRMFHTFLPSVPAPRFQTRATCQQLAAGSARGPPPAEPSRRVWEVVISPAVGLS